jgi:hypothetical protein
VFDGCPTLFFFFFVEVKNVKMSFKLNLFETISKEKCPLIPLMGEAMGGKA